MVKTNKPLFMWAGGKNKMIKSYNTSGILPSKVDRYIEPFFGGGAMFLYVVDRYKPKNCIINDVNSGIINIYKTIKSDAKNFLKEVDALEKVYIPKSKIDRKLYYYEMRASHAFDYSNWSKTKEAAVLYFLMKTGFNGIWQINKNTDGRFGTPSGLLNHKTNIYDKNLVLYWSSILQNTDILCCDWRDVVGGVVIPDSFYFLDPPYRGSFTSYGQTFTEQDQIDLTLFARSIPDSSRVILCNDDVGDGFFQKIQGNLRIEEYNTTHTAGRRATERDGSRSAKAVKEIALHNSNPDSHFNMWF